VGSRDGLQALAKGIFILYMGMKEHTLFIILTNKRKTYILIIIIIIIIIFYVL